MAVPLTGGCVVPSMANGNMNNYNSSFGSSAYVRHSAVSSPILVFLLFHKAIRWELEKLHKDALGLQKQECGDFGVGIQTLLERYRFLHLIYKHHCNAEDEVIFPALDMRVKNVALTYFLEHKGENDLFDQVFELLNSALEDSNHVSVKLRRELVCCTEAIQTSLCQHMSKEEEQVFPLLVQHYSFGEQAALVWQFLCSIPVSLMEEFLPWLVSSLSPDECQDMMKSMQKIVPQEKLLQKVIFTWLERKNICNSLEAASDDDSSHKIGYWTTSMKSKTSNTVAHAFTTIINECCNKKCKIPRLVMSNHGRTNDNLVNEFPIDEILHWHNAIRNEVKELAAQARHMQFSGDFSNLISFNERLQFVAEVCILHSIAEDKILFPAVDQKVKNGVCYINDHAREENQFNDLRCLIEHFQTAGASSSLSDFHSKLCAHADQIVETIEKHFLDEEEVVLPLARKHCDADEQRYLLYQGLRVMPLKLLERVLPWLVKSSNHGKVKQMLRNLRLAAPASDAALVTLLSGWVCKGRSLNKSNNGNFTCIGSDSRNDYPKTKIDSVSSNVNEDFNTCNALSEGFDTNHSLPKQEISKAGKRSREECTALNENISGEASCPSGTSCSSQPCCVPGLGMNDINLAGGTISTRRNLRSLSLNSPSASSLSNTIWGRSSVAGPSGTGQTPKPIDLIFQFHKAFRKDLEYLDAESARLMDHDESFARHFSRRFRLLWSLYRAHSSAEDEIVFPALESKEALHNISHSYTLDHRQEEKLFSDISDVISEILQLHEGESRGTPSTEWQEKYCGLAEKLQRMCKSIKVTLDHHVFREELELWPLFDRHFTIDEQDKIVGRIIGISGAEVLQSMLPWVTNALTQEEQNTLMDTWRQATRNTMFDEWLSAWWKDSPSSSSSSSLSEKVSSPALEKVAQDSVDHGIQKFKPGWKDIFRMNQNELESAVRGVSSDASLDPRHKAYLIQNLMTSRWIAAQQKIPQSKSFDESDNEDLPGRCPSYKDQEKKILGCEHYKRNCKLKAACCDQLFTCRFCHDKVSDHTMDRKATKEMMCMVCLQIQPVAANCSTSSCKGLPMAKYFCSICKFFDDEREIYHCPFCNVCRVGRGLGIDYFHCMTCNGCMSKTLAVHRCRERGLESNCPICHDFLFSSSAPVKALPCGHFMHSDCFRIYTCSHYTCPICCKSMGDMAVYFGMLDALLSGEQLPEEYQGRTQDILCNDCEKKGAAPFHWLYHKCSSCGSYNTRVI